MDSKSDRWKNADMLRNGTKPLTAATADVFHFLSANIRRTNWRPDPLSRERSTSADEWTRNPSELIQPSSSKMFQSDSSMPTGQMLGGGKTFKKRQKSAMERRFSALPFWLCISCRPSLCLYAINSHLLNASENAKNVAMWPVMCTTPTHWPKQNSI